MANQYYPPYSPQPHAPAPDPRQFALLKGRAVSNVEEARAFPIDFDGSPHFFTDLPNGKIYVKRLEDNGRVSFGEYVYTVPPEPPPPPVPLTQADIGTAVVAAMTPLLERLARLEGDLQTITGGVSNVQHQPNATTRSTSAKRQPASDTAAGGSD